MDSYYNDRSSLPFGKRKLLNYDEPEAFDHLLLTKHLSKILNGEQVSVPVYDFVTHIRQGTVETYPADLLIVEGIYALYFEELRKYYNLKIFIETSEKIRTDRRLSRDTVERGRTRKEVIAQLNNTVIPMHKEWVESTKKYADLIIDSGRNDIKSCSKIIIDCLSEEFTQVFK
jgi:uridine kinase